MIPEVRWELGCYHWVYISLHFIKEYGVDNKKDEVGNNPDPYEEDLRIWYSKMRESAIGAWFLMKQIEGWMGRWPFYMLISEMYTIRRRMRW